MIRPLEAYQWHSEFQCYALHSKSVIPHRNLEPLSELAKLSELTLQYEVVACRVQTA